MDAHVPRFPCGFLPASPAAPRAGRLLPRAMMSPASSGDNPSGFLHPLRRTHPSGKLTLPSGLALFGNKHEKRGLGLKHAPVEVPLPQPRKRGVINLGRMLCLLFGELFYFQMICFL